MNDRIAFWCICVCVFDLSNLTYIDIRRWHANADMPESCRESTNRRFLLIAVASEAKLLLFDGAHVHVFQHFQPCFTHSAKCQSFPTMIQINNHFDVFWSFARAARVEERLNVKSPRVRSPVTSSKQGWVNANKYHWPKIVLPRISFLCLLDPWLLKHPKVAENEVWKCCVHEVLTSPKKRRKLWLPWHRQACQACWSMWGFVRHVKSQASKRVQAYQSERWFSEAFHVHFSRHSTCSFFCHSRPLKNWKVLVLALRIRHLESGGTDVKPGDRVEHKVNWVAVAWLIYVADL